MVDFTENGTRVQQLRRPDPLPVEAFYGLAGSYVRAVEPETEADPVAILVQLLVMVGNAIGRTAHFKVSGCTHHLNLFALVVGATGKARKGTSLTPALQLMRAVDPDWADQRILHSLSSGEYLIHAVRDPVVKTKRKDDRADSEPYEIVVDEGARDKRELVITEEFGGVLGSMARQGNTLSAVVRQAWDGNSLQVASIASSARATNPHISIIAHITQEELLRAFTNNDQTNGFANRFLFVLAHRSKLLPLGGNQVSIGEFVAQLKRAVAFAQNVGELKRDDRANNFWCDAYETLSEARTGLAGSVTARAEMQTMRLAAIFAVLDESNLIRVEHLQAALALWNYCDYSAQKIFGCSTGNKIADKVMEALRESSNGLSKTEIAAALSGHYKSEKLDEALGLLQNKGLAFCTTHQTKGRPAARWFATDSSSDDEDREISEKSELSMGHTGLNSHNSQPIDADDSIFDVEVSE